MFKRKRKSLLESNLNYYLARPSGSRFSSCDLSKLICKRDFSYTSRTLKGNNNKDSYPIGLRSQKNSLIPIKPVALYDPGEERELILNQNKGRAGVYR
jgi:hypothetical protein